MANKNGQPKKQAFLAAYAECGTVRHAAEAAKMARSQHYVWLKEDGEYAKAFEEAKGQAVDNMEAEARRRAVDGVNEPVIYQGKLQGIWVNEEGDIIPESAEGAVHIPLTVKKYSDTLLIFLLKGALPEKYRERHDVTIDAPTLRSEAERLAEENGLSVEEVVAEAERIAKGKA